MTTNKEKKWYRNCPKCGKEYSYTRKSSRDIAEKENRNCLSCSKKGKKRKPITEETRKRISESLKGKKYKPITEETRKRLSESKLGKNNPMYGKKQSEESNRKRRLTLLKNIETRCGQVIPNYNPDGCEIIRWFNMYYGFNFQHAENGGEVNIGGYYPDGVDQEKMTIIEIDEKQHFNSDGKLKQKDTQRQRYLEGLGYKFIRIRI